MFAHLVRTGGAVEPDQRNFERMNDRCCRGDIGADQQRAGRLHRHLDEDRGLGASLDAGQFHRVDRGLDLQRILTGFDQYRIDPAGDQTLCLNQERCFECVVTDMAERGQLGARPDRAEHEALAPIASEQLGRLARDLAGATIDLIGLRTDSEFAQGDRAGAECIGFHHIGAGGEELGVRLAHQIGAREAKHIGAILMAMKVALHRQAKSLDRVPMPPSHSSTRCAR